MRVLQKILSASLLLLPFSGSSLAAQNGRVGSGSSFEEEPGSTTFNGQPIPAMEALTAANIKDKIKNGNWLVEFHSPYCRHCRALAPTWQTIYEYYYSSSPVLGGSNTENADSAPESFTEYYDFHFAKLDCTAYGDTCTQFEIPSYPNIRLFQNGELNKDRVINGQKPMGEYVDMIEASLESIKPGSRPKGGPKLPEAGADHSPDYTPAKPSAEPSAEPSSSESANEPKEASIARKPEEPKVSPNPSGTSITLNEGNFATFVGNKQEYWFIKFHVPWCGHCKTLAPIWEEMASSMKSKLNVGEVNCDVSPALCKEAGVDGFPTIYLFRGTDRVEYEGTRKLEDLTSYADNIASFGSGIDEVNLKNYLELEKSSPVIFVYNYDFAASSEDLEALSQLPLYAAGHAKFVKSKDPKVANLFGARMKPFLAVSRRGRKLVYGGNTPSEMRDTRKMFKWIRDYRMGLVPELTPANAMEIMDKSFSVLAIISTTDNAEKESAKKEIFKAAEWWEDIEQQITTAHKDMYRNERKLAKGKKNNKMAIFNIGKAEINLYEYDVSPIRFAWVDGIYWEKWVQNTYGIDGKSQPVAVVINDQENHRFWDRDDTGKPLAAAGSSLVSTLPAVIVHPPKLSARSSSSGFGSIYYSIRSMYRDNGLMKWYTLLLVGAILFYILRRASVLRAGSRFLNRSNANYRLPIFQPGVASPTGTSTQNDLKGSFTGGGRNKNE